MPENDDGTVRLQLLLNSSDRCFRFHFGEQVGIWTDDSDNFRVKMLRKQFVVLNGYDSSNVQTISSPFRGYGRSRGTVQTRKETTDHGRPKVYLHDSRMWR